jgi:hypothetical protein
VRERRTDRFDKNRSVFACTTGQNVQTAVQWSGVINVLLCRVCGREIAKGCVFVIKHMRARGRDLWLPVHIRCNADLSAGRARLDGAALASPPGRAIGDGLMLPVCH